MNELRGSGFKLRFYDFSLIKERVKSRKEDLLFFCLYFLLSLVCFHDFILNGGIIQQDDFTYPLQAKNLYRTLFSAWNKNSNSPAIYRFPEYSVLLLFAPIVILFDPTSTQLMVGISIFMMVVSGLSSYYCCLYFLETSSEQNKGLMRIASGIAGVAYEISPFFFAEGLHVMIRVGYALAPLIFTTFVIALEEKRPRLVIIGATLLVFASSDVHWMVYIPLIFGNYILISILYLAIYSNLSRQEICKELITRIGLFIELLFVYIILCSFWLIPFFLLRNNISLIGANADILTYEYFYQNATLINVLRGMGVHSTGIMYNSTSLPNPLTSVFAQLLINLGNYLLIITALIGMSSHKQQKVVFCLSILLIEMIFFTVGINMAKQFWEIIFYDVPFNTLVTRIFRAPRHQQLVILFSTFLSSFGFLELFKKIEKLKKTSIRIRNRIRLFFTFIFLVLILLSSWPLFTGNFSGKLEPQEIPESFLEAEKWLNNQKGSFHVLWMPEYAHRTATWYEGYGITDIRLLLAKNPYMLTLTAFGPFYYHYLAVRWDMPTHLTQGTLQNAGALLSQFGIKYLVFHNDIPNLAGLSEKALETLQNQTDLIFKVRFDYIWIFENTEFDNNIQFPQKLFLSSGGLDLTSRLVEAPGFSLKEQYFRFLDQDLEASRDLDAADGIVLDLGQDISDLDLLLHPSTKTIIPGQIERFQELTTGWNSLYASQKRLIDLPLQWNQIRSANKITTSQLDFGKTVSYTESPFVLPEDIKLDEGSISASINFDEDREEFYSIGDQIILNQSTEFDPKGGLTGTISRGNSVIWQTAQRRFPPLIKNHWLGVKLNVWGRNMSDFIIRMNLYNEYGLSDTIPLVTDLKGSFDSQQIEKIGFIPNDTNLIQFLILAKQNPNSSSKYGIDDISFYNFTRFEKASIMSVPFTIKKSDTYEFRIRALYAPTGGELKLTLDNQEEMRISTQELFSSFQWKVLDSIFLERGKHYLYIQNTAGFNAVNLLELIPTSEINNRELKVKEFLKNQDIILLGAPVASEEFFQDQTFKIPVSGVYRLAAPSMSIDRLKLGNNSLVLAEQDQNWWLSQAFPLNKGNQTLSIVSTEELTKSWNFNSQFDYNEWEQANENSSYRNRYTLSHENNTLRFTLNESSWGWKQLNSPLIRAVFGRSYDWQISLTTQNIYELHVKMTEYDINRNKLNDIYIKNLGTGSFNLTETFRYNPTNSNIAFVQLELWNGHLSQQALPNILEVHNASVVTDYEFSLPQLILFRVNLPNDTLRTIFQGNESKKPVIMNWKRIDDSRQIVEVKSEEPFTLAFLESFNSLWKAHVKGGQSYQAFPLQYGVNGFKIKETGDLTILIEFTPQVLLERSMLVSIFGIVGICLFLIESRLQTRFKMKKAIKSQLDFRKKKTIQKEQEK